MEEVLELQSENIGCETILHINANEMPLNT